MPNLAENKFATEAMIFYALFSLYQLSRLPPMVRFQRLKRVGQSNMNCAFAAFNAVRHTISQKYSQKHFSAQHALIDDVESFSLGKWRVLDACYRCSRSCIMEISWLLLSLGSLGSRILTSGQSTLGSKSALTVSGVDFFGCCSVFDCKG